MLICCTVVLSEHYGQRLKYVRRRLSQHDTACAHGETGPTDQLQTSEVDYFVSLTHRHRKLQETCSSRSIGLPALSEEITTQETKPKTGGENMKFDICYGEDDLVVAAVVTGGVCVHTLDRIRM